MTLYRDNESLAQKKTSNLGSKALVRCGLFRERAIILAIQQSTILSIEPIKMFMHSLGQTISGEFLLLYFALLYWVIDQRTCNTAIWLVPVAEIVTNFIKWGFGRPRPGWTCDKIEIRAASHEYTFPSSHASISVSVAMFIYMESPEVATKHNLLALCALICFSRVYEGAHYPRDVLVGAILGMCLALFHFMFALPFAETTCSIGNNLQKCCFLIGLPLTVFITYLLFFVHSLLSKYREVKPSWAVLALKSKCHRGGKLQPHFVPLSSCIGMCGVLGGLFIARPFLDYVPLNEPETFYEGCLRFICGAIGLIGLFFLIRTVEKSSLLTGYSTICLVIRLCRYAIMPVYIQLLAPMVFNMFNFE